MMLIVSTEEFFGIKRSAEYITFITNQLHVSSEAKYIIPLF